MYQVMKINDHSAFDKPFPYYQEPKELGTFSLDENRQFNQSGRVKYLAWPQDSNRVHFNLNNGYEEAIKKEFGLEEKLDNLLRWIKEAGLPKKINTAFVCYRGLLTTLLSTPYENQDGWIICASKFNNTIYLCQFHTPERKEREENMSEREKLMSSWGYKFEQFLTTDKRGGKPNIREPVNEKEEFCSVVKTRLNSHLLVFGAEMDCVDPTNCESQSMHRYLELKTSRIISSQRQEKNFQRFKLLKWWAQSFLIGIQRIICGFRDDNGIVHNLKTFNLKEITRVTQGSWSPTISMNFCDQFLSFVKQCVIKDDPLIVYKFEWKPRHDNIIVEELEPQSPFCFLPDWYTNLFLENCPF